MTGPPFEKGGAAVASVAIWERATHDLHSLCTGRSIPFHHVLQPNLAVPRSKSLSEEERAILIASPEWVHAAETGYPLLREASARLRRLGLHMIDGTTAFADVDGTTYRDAGHLSEEGERRFADFLASLGVPFPAAQAPFVAGLEFVGGICLVLGLLTRLMGLGLAATMVVALLTADRALFAAAWLPSGEMLVTERPGRLRVVRNGVLDPKPIGGVPQVRARGQGGLLEVLPHPQFAANRLLYLSLSKPNEDGSEGTTAVVRGRDRATT